MRKTFQDDTPETSDCVLCDYCGGTLHDPEHDVFWEQTADHTCEPMLQARINVLTEALQHLVDLDDMNTTASMEQEGIDKAKAALKE